MTTRIEDKPYDGLLLEKGGTGFPTLMFLDAEGRKLMKHGGPRTPGGFEGSLEVVDEFLELSRKADSGDSKAAAGVLIRQLELEWYGIDEARKRADAIEKVPSKAKKQLEQLLIDTEVRDAYEQAGDDAEARFAAGKRFAAMYEEKQIPENQTQLIRFWVVMADYAERERDKKLFKKIIKEFEDTVDSGSRNRKTLKWLEERLDDFPKS